MGQDLQRGALVGVPIVLGYLPIAFSFGVGAAQAGLSWGEAVAMSVLMYSGAAQFMAIALITSGASFWVICATLVGMSLRHLLYGPGLLRSAGLQAPPKGVAIWGFGLTDEVFGAALGAVARGRALTPGFIWGLSAVSYLAWVLGTAAGAWAGAGAMQRWPALDAGLGFMLTALFLALLLSIMRRAQVPVIAAAVSGTALGGYAVWPSDGPSTTAGIMAGLICGILVGSLKGQRDAG